jgi:hypothetical protein
VGDKAQELAYYLIIFMLGIKIIIVVVLFVSKNIALVVLVKDILLCSC